MDWASLLFSFHGRINRAKYWLTMLIYAILGVILGLVGLVLGQNLAFGILAFIVELAAFISGLAVIIKRLHDRDKSAWWLLVFYVVPVALALIGTWIGMTSGSLVVPIICGVVSVAVGIWAFIEWGCLRGTPGTNQYGPDPLGPNALRPQS
jgi:uncharacterized membrane protein YhaH (DUF805 family)